MKNNRRKRERMRNSKMLEKMKPIIAEQLNVNKSAVNKCIQRNFKEFKSVHLKNRKHLKFYENEVRKITKYESKQYMSDKTFILKNRFFYETKKMEI